MKSKKTLGNLPVNRIAHQDRNMINQAAMLMKYSTITWGIVIGIPADGCHIRFHPLPQANVGMGITGSLKKVVRRESSPGGSTRKITG